jgi:hypothetical protein
MRTRLSSYLVGAAVAALELLLAVGAGSLAWAGGPPPRGQQAQGPPPMTVPQSAYSFHSPPELHSSARSPRHRSAPGEHSSSQAPISSATTTSIHRIIPSSVRIIPSS